MSYDLILKKYKGNKRMETIEYGVPKLVTARKEAVKYLSNPKWFDGRTHYISIYEGQSLVGKVFVTWEVFWKPSKGGKYLLKKDGNLGSKLE